MNLFDRPQRRQLVSWLVFLLVVGAGLSMGDADARNRTETPGAAGFQTEMPDPAPTEFRYVCITGVGWTVREPGEVSVYGQGSPYERACGAVVEGDEIDGYVLLSNAFAPTHRGHRDISVDPRDWHGWVPATAVEPVTDDVFQLVTTWADSEWIEELGCGEPDRSMIRVATTTGGQWWVDLGRPIGDLVYPQSKFRASSEPELLRVEAGTGVCAWRGIGKLPAGGSAREPAEVHVDLVWSGVELDRLLPLDRTLCPVDRPGSERVRFWTAPGESNGALVAELAADQCVLAEGPTLDGWTLARPANQEKLALGWVDTRGFEAQENTALPHPAPRPVPGDVGCIFALHAPPSVAVRSSPDQSSGVMATVDDGDCMVRILDQDRSWTRIRFFQVVPRGLDVREGWISSSNIERAANLPSPQGAAIAWAASHSSSNELTSLPTALCRPSTETARICRIRWWDWLDVTELCSGFAKQRIGHWHLRTDGASLRVEAADDGSWVVADELPTPAVQC